MYIWGSSPTVTSCEFTGNEAVVGGAICPDSGTAFVRDSRFSGNSAFQGGTIQNVNNNILTLFNCLFYNNTAEEFGGGINNKNSSSSTVTNCTFSQNYVDTIDGGGAIFNDFTSDSIVINSILWGDSGPGNQGSEIQGTATVTYSDVEGGADGEGNIDADPEFVDAEGGDLHLLSDSPCIDAGNSTPLLEASISQDLDGMMRFVDIIAIADTGIGLFGFVDMGAYEFSCSDIPGDINCDGKVDLIDLGMLAANWLEGV